MSAVVGLLLLLAAAAGLAAVLLLLVRLVLAMGGDHPVLEGAWVLIGFGLVGGLVVVADELWQASGRPWWWGPVLSVPVAATLVWRTWKAVRR